MQDEILNASITIASVQDTGEQIKIKDEQGRTWSFFKTKRAGGMTNAYEQFQQYKVGELVGVGYKMAGQQGNIRSILNFQPPRYDQAPKPLPMGNPGPAKQPWSSGGGGLVPTRNFEKEAYEKCCSIWAAANIQRAGIEHATIELTEGRYWELFQAIRADGEKRFTAGSKPVVHTPALDDDAPPFGDEDIPGEGVV